MMAEEKCEEIELVKDENGIVPHEALNGDSELS